MSRTLQIYQSKQADTLQGLLLNSSFSDIESAASFYSDDLAVFLMNNFIAGDDWKLHSRLQRNVHSHLVKH